MIKSLIKEVNRLINPPKRVFISYDHSNERSYRDLLCAWHANQNFDFSIERCSPNKAIKSKNADKIKDKLYDMIGDADYMIVLLGQRTHQREWVRWEVKMAKEQGLEIVVVKIDRSYKTPNCLIGAGARFVYSFNLHDIKMALNSF